MKQGNGESEVEGLKSKVGKFESKEKENGVKVRYRERESRTETSLPARGLSGLQAAEQWQETSAWNFSLRAGMRAPYPGSRGPTPPCGQQRRHSVRSSGYRQSGGGSILGVGCKLKNTILVPLLVWEFSTTHFTFTFLLSLQRVSTCSLSLLIQYIVV